MATTFRRRARSTRSSTEGSRTASLSGCTPALHQKLSYVVASSWTSSNSSSVVQMQSARSTSAAAISALISGSRLLSSGKLRWQCESTNIEDGAATAPLSDRLCRLCRGQHRAERLFDLLLEDPGLL